MKDSRFASASKSWSGLSFRYVASYPIIRSHLVSFPNIPSKRKRMSYRSSLLSLLADRRSVLSQLPELR